MKPFGWTTWNASQHWYDEEFFLYLLYVLSETHLTTQVIQRCKMPNLVGTNAELRDDVVSLSHLGVELAFNCSRSLFRTLKNKLSFCNAENHNPLLPPLAQSQIGTIPALVSQPVRIFSLFFPSPSPSLASSHFPSLSLHSASSSLVREKS